MYVELLITQYCACAVLIFRLWCWLAHAAVVAAENDGSSLLVPAVSPLWCHDHCSVIWLLLRDLPRPNGTEAIHSRDSTLNRLKGRHLRPPHVWLQFLRLLVGSLHYWLRLDPLPIVKSERHVFLLCPFISRKLRHVFYFGVLLQHSWLRRRVLVDVHLLRLLDGVLLHLWRCLHWLTRWLGLVLLHLRTRDCIWSFILLLGIWILEHLCSHRVVLLSRILPASLLHLLTVTVFHLRTHADIRPGIEQVHWIHFLVLHLFAWQIMSINISSPFWRFLWRDELLSSDVWTRATGWVKFKERIRNATFQEIFIWIFWLLYDFNFLFRVIYIIRLRNIKDLFSRLCFFLILILFRVIRWVHVWAWDWVLRQLRRCLAIRFSFSWPLLLTWSWHFAFPH